MMTEHKTKSSIATVGCISEPLLAVGAFMQWEEYLLNVLKKPDGQGML
jgi:hypothetical protein